MKTDWVVYFCVIFGVILDLRDVMFYNIPRDVRFYNIPRDVRFYNIPENFITSLISGILCFKIVTTEGEKNSNREIKAILPPINHLI